MDKRSNNKTCKIFKLHSLFLFLSLCGIMGKYAARQEFLTLSFFLFYGGSLFVLAIYSLFWQRILAKVPLSTAYSNRGITVVWGFLWGALLFEERITPVKITAALLVIGGIAVISSSED